MCLFRIILLFNQTKKTQVTLKRISKKIKSIVFDLIQGEIAIPGIGLPDIKLCNARTDRSD
jgi:hypothetical protein